MEEVLDEINSSLNDKRGLIPHQRRLAFSLSLGSSVLVEEFFSKKNILKPGIKINHLWLRKSRENIKELLKDKITSQIEKFPELNSIIDKAIFIERERDKLAYGKSISEKTLKEKIKAFLELKKEVENA